MKKALTAILTISICLFCFAVAGCGSDRDTDAYTALNVKSDKLNAGTLVDRLYNEENKNTIISHTSLNAALGLIGEGASSSSLDSIENYLGMDMRSFTKKFRNTYDSYSKLENGQVLLANGLWLNTATDSRLKPEYESKVKGDYHSEICARDFTDGKTDDIINRWCSKHTKGLIDNIADDNLSDCTLVGANALYFNCMWLDPFEPAQTSEETFTLFDGSTENIDMMHSTESAYLENDKATGFIKYYQNGMCFVGILPKTENDFSLSEIDPENLISTQTVDYDVNIMLPEFKAADSNSLVDVLSDMGISDIFDPDTSDFSRMATGDRLFIDSLLQKTYIDVNETGTEAAAVTEFSVKATALPPEHKEVKEVFLNRPFAFAIYDEANDEFLFIGKITDLK